MINKTAINAILFIHDDLSMASMEGNDENLLKMGCRWPKFCLWNARTMCD